MLADTPGKKRNQFRKDYVVFDLETTGLNHEEDAVIEVSALKVQNEIVVNEFSTLVNPERAIPYGASMVNGITDEMVAQSPSFDEVFPQFLDFAGDEVLVGHNIHCFDMKFLYRDAKKYWGLVPNNDYIDTLSLARRCLPQLQHHTLSALSNYYGISTAGAHRALNDCYMNYKVYERLALETVESGEKIPVCPKCGQILVKRKGKYGEFWGCSGYPECKYTRNAE